MYKFMSWVFCKLLPNISVLDPIESTDFAMVSPNDTRIKSRVNDKDDVASFSGEFTNVRKKHIEPSILLFKKKNKKHRPWERAINEFRDVLSICIVPKCLANSIINETQVGILSSEFFSYYPYFPQNTKKDASLVSESWHKKDLFSHQEFIGQMNPSLPSDIK